MNVIGHLCNPRRITVLVFVNFVIYASLPFWASYFLLFVLGLGVLAYVAFFVAGIACCVGIIRHVRWGFLAGVLMWTVEGIVFSSAAYVNTEVVIGPNSIHYTNPIYVFPFIVVSLCRFASAAYLAREEKLKRTGY
jgi:hypothetical protein